MAKEMHSTTRYANSLTQLVRTSDANGATVDRKGFEHVEVIWTFGAEGDTLAANLYMELELEHSDDDSTWADCADTDIIGESTETTTNTGTCALLNAVGDAAGIIYRCAYTGTKRYIRPVYNVTGSHSSGTSSACIVALSGALNKPVANP